MKFIGDPVLRLKAWWSRLLTRAGWWDSEYVDDAAAPAPPPAPEEAVSPLIWARPWERDDEDLVIVMAAWTYYYGRPRR